MICSCETKQEYYIKFESRVNNIQFEKNDYVGNINVIIKCEFNEYYKIDRCLVLHYVQNEYIKINNIFEIFLLSVIRGK